MDALPISLFVALMSLLGQPGSGLLFDFPQNQKLQARGEYLTNRSLATPAPTADPNPIMCGDKCIELVLAPECPGASHNWQDTTHCTPWDVTNAAIGTLCESDEFPHCGDNMANNCWDENGGQTTDVYRLIEWCGPTPLPTPPQGSAAGDPHLSSIRGEQFDVTRAGSIELMHAGDGHASDNQHSVSLHRKRNNSGPIQCGDKCIEMIKSEDCPNDWLLPGHNWQDTAHCNPEDVLANPVGTLCESDEPPHCGEDTADNCPRSLDVYRIVEWCGPTPLPTPPQGSVAGDPHVSSIRGEHFDVSHTGSIELMHAGDK